MPPKLGSLGNGVFQWKVEGYRTSNDDTKMWESPTRSTTTLKELPAQLELNLERFVNNLQDVSLTQKIRKICIQTSKTNNFLIFTYKKTKN